MGILINMEDRRKKNNTFSSKDDAYKYWLELKNEHSELLKKHTAVGNSGDFERASEIFNEGGAIYCEMQDIWNKHLI